MQRGTTEEDKQLLRAALVLPGQLTQSLLLWRGFEQASIILPFGSERFFVLQDCYASMDYDLFHQESTQGTNTDIEKHVSSVLL